MKECRLANLGPLCVWSAGPASHRIILPEVIYGQAWWYLLDTCTACLTSSGASIRDLDTLQGCVVQGTMTW